MNNDYKKECWKRYLENQKYEKYDKEDLVDEIIELQAENQQLKKQKDDVVEFINKRKTEDDWLEVNANRLLRMLGEIDVED